MSKTRKALLAGSAGLAAIVGAMVGTGAAQASQFNFQCPGEVNAQGEVVDGSGDVIRIDPGNPNSPARTLCLHVTGGDGFIRMADGVPLYSFGFSPVELATWSGAPAEDPGTRGLKAFLPAPLLRVSEGQELYLTLSNTPFIIRPDLFDPHTIHWHGFPNASAVFDGVPENSISPNPLASVTYYYQVVEPGTFMWHCHVEASEHMQMGMLGNLYVEPVQNTIATGTDLDGHIHAPGDLYAYNDGDGSTLYDVEAPIQIHSFDPVFHNASHDVQALPFAEMRDTYSMFNGRGYPDTVRTDPFLNANPDFPGEDGVVEGGLEVNSQPETALVEAAPGEKVLVRLSSLSTTDYYTVVSPDLTMNVIGQGGHHRVGPENAGAQQVYYETHQLTLGGGQAFDVIVEIPAGADPGDRFFIYTSNLNFLANDVEDYGGMMTEIHVVAAS